MKRVMVTGCGGPAGVNFVLSLRDAPEKFYIVGTDASLWHTKLNRHVDKMYLVPRCTDPAYVDALNEIIEREKIEFVHPQPDVEVLAISENREKINAIIFLPSRRTIRICQDKFESARIWDKKGIPVAKTIKIRRDHLEEDIRKAFEELGSPIWIRATRGAGGRGSTLARNFETAYHWIMYWYSRGVDWEFIAQEYLPGRNLAFHSVWKDGELVVSQARERLEYIYPHLAPSGITGTPAVQRTIHDDIVNEVATEAILAIDPEPNGIFCVDLKENKDGEPCPTEINAGRFFTTSYFFTYATKKLGKGWIGNLPYIYVKLAYGEKIPPLPKYNILPPGIYWVRHIDAGCTMVLEEEWEKVPRIVQ